MIFGLDDGSAAVWAASIAAVASMVVAVLGFRTRRVVKTEAASIREQNSEQHGEGQKLVEQVAGSVLALHELVSDMRDDVAGVKSSVEKLTDRVEILETDP